jgi:hypothetical protein
MVQAQTFRRCDKGKGQGYRASADLPQVRKGVRGKAQGYGVRGMGLGLLQTFRRCGEQESTEQESIDSQHAGTGTARWGGAAHRALPPAPAPGAATCWRSVCA